MREEPGLNIDPTNIDLIFLQQELFLATCWAQVAATKPIGLVQRCLFGFGARLGSGTAAHQGFLDDVIVPIIESLFTAALRRAGPRITGVGPPDCRFTASQQDVVNEIEEIGKLFARKDQSLVCFYVMRAATVCVLAYMVPCMMLRHGACEESVQVSLHEAFTKALYWFGTAVLGTASARTFWSICGRMRWRGVCQTSSFQKSRTDVSCQLVILCRRYLYGQAVVSTAAHQRVWQGFQQGLEQQVVMDMLPPPAHHSRLPWDYYPPRTCSGPICLAAYPQHLAASR